MSWREKLFGKQAEPRGTTTTPPPESQWDTLGDATTQVGHSATDFLNRLRGKPVRPQLVCKEGHAVLPGNNTCPYGHYVG